MSISDIKGEVYRLKKSRKNDKLLIAYTDTGKVIIPENQNSLHYGFAQVEDFTDKGNCYVAKMKNVPYDFYCGYNEGEIIPYDEFCEVLKNHNFKHEYQTKIDNTNFFDVWANLDTGSLITIETWDKLGIKTYNSVDVYITIDKKDFWKISNFSGFSHGNKSVCCFDFCNSGIDKPLSKILSLSNNSRNWNGNTPTLWHYGDGININYAKALARIYDFKDDIGTLFNMKLDEIFAKYAEAGYTV